MWPIFALLSLVVSLSVAMIGLYFIGAVNENITRTWKEDCHYNPFVVALVYGIAIPILFALDYVARSSGIATAQNQSFPLILSMLGVAGGSAVLIVIPSIRLATQYLYPSSQFANWWSLRIETAGEPRFKWVTDFA